VQPINGQALLSGLFVFKMVVSQTIRTTPTTKCCGDAMLPHRRLAFGMYILRAHQNIIIWNRKI